MCANYQPSTSARFQQNFERLPPGIDWKPESSPATAPPLSPMRREKMACWPPSGCFRTGQSRPL
jgi:hypothetical protein